MSTRAIAAGLAVSALVAIAAGAGLVRRMESATNKVALAAQPKRVSTVRTRAATYRSSRSYVGTLRPWNGAEVGPQLVSAYVDTVLVRPGAVVKRGDVLATLDCRDVGTEQAAVLLQARAIEAREKALADEADRTRRLLDGGFASPNEVEQALAQSASETAQLGAQKAQIAHGSLRVADCVLRAPFDGEIGDRFVDPGAFVRPGSAIVSVIDRSTARFVADAPESDFGVVAPQTAVRIHVDATGQDIEGIIARRAPHADPEVRTVHFEVDVPNPGRSMPVDTTAEVRIDYGDAIPATALPLQAATIRGVRASVFVADGETARLRAAKVLGEVGADLLVDPSLEPGALVVTEGRALINDGDRIAAKEQAAAAGQPVTPVAASSNR